MYVYGSAIIVNSDLTKGHLADKESSVKKVLKLETFEEVLLTEDIGIFFFSK